MCSREAFVHKSGIIQPKEIKSSVGELSSYKSLTSVIDYTVILAKPMCKDLQIVKAQ